MATRSHTQIMTASQQSGRRAAADWPLAAGQALRLEIGPGPRWLGVTHGRLWLTTTGRDGELPDDVVLEAGQQLALAHGSDWVVEAAWGDTRFQLLVPPQACPRFVGAAIGWAQRWREVFAGGGLLAGARH